MSSSSSMSRTRPPACWSNSVSDIVDVPVSAVRPAPDLERDEHGLIEGLVLLDTDIVALLDLAAVIREGGAEAQIKTSRAA